MIMPNVSSTRTLSFAIGFAMLTTGTIVFQGCSRHEKETKTAEQVFAKWLNKEQVFHDHDLEQLKDQITPDYAATVKEKFAELHSVMTQFNPFLASFYATKTESPSDFNVALNSQLKEKLAKIYFMVEHDMPGFVAFLQNNGFESGKLNNSDTESNFRDIILRDRGLIEMFFANKDPKVETEHLRAVANRFFEFCFDPETWPMFEALINHDDSHPIVRILYATTWYYMAGNGWKYWNKSCIDNMKKEADKGKKIVYIAGGSDIYQLLRHGIYNIEVIDPQLPTQPKYYSEGWDWLIKKDAVGDEITMGLPDKKLLLRRESYSEDGTFRAKLVTEAIVDLPKSTTEWVVYDQASNKKLGTVTLSRRFSTQEDFVQNDKQIVMISFNEMYFVVTPNQSKSWGINPEQFAPDFQLYAKQLREPVSREVMINMRKTELSKFSFIALGTEIN